MEPDTCEGEPEITPQMIEAGVRALYRMVPMDIARALSADEDIVTEVYLEMAKLRAPRSRA